LAFSTDGPKSKTNWKKFKSSCMYCGKQGHKSVDCHAKARVVAGQRTPAPKNASRNNNNSSQNSPSQGRGGQNRNSQTPRMETRCCNGCNQVCYLCPNNTGQGNQCVNNAFVGHVEYDKENETKTDFSVTADLLPPQVPTKKEDFDQYVRLQKDATGEWDKAIFVHVGHEDYEESPPGTDFGYWVRKGAEESDEGGKDPYKPDKKEDAKVNNKAYNSDDDKKLAAVDKPWSD
jgi:hypothetical protein